MIRSPSERNGRSKARSLFRVSHRGAGSQSLGLSSTAPPGHRQGVGREAGLPGIEPAPIWEPWACKARTLTTCATVPGQKICIFLNISFYWKGRYTRGETERQIFRPMIHSPSGRNGRYYADPKPGASSGSPMWVQVPKALGRPRLLSQATGRELEGKRGCWDRTGAHMGSRACKARTFNHLRHRAGPQINLSTADPPLKCPQEPLGWILGVLKYMLFSFPYENGLEGPARWRRG